MHTYKIILPSDQEALAAAAAYDQLALLEKELQSIALVENKKSDAFQVPDCALHLLSYLLKELAAGNAIKVESIPAEVGIHESAKMLNVSVAHLNQLLQQEALPYSQSGLHQKINLRDLLDYQAKQTVASYLGMEELAVQAQELGMGY